MLVDGSRLDRGAVLEADVCIAGAGVAGIVLACELVREGQRVILIESGGESFDEQAQSLNVVENYSSIYADPSTSRLRGLGGTSNHWLNNTSPLSAIDFEPRDWIPNSGWPITLGELRPYYNAAAKYCGVGQVEWEALPPRSPGSLIQLERVQDRLLQRRSRMAIPGTRFFERHGDSLTRSSFARVLTWATLVDFEWDAGSRSVTSFLFANTANIRFRVNAGRFVLGLGGIENARMLLWFNTKSNNALGNRFGNVGRYFMDHPTVRPAALISTVKGLGETLSDLGGQIYGLRYFELSAGMLRKNRLSNAKFSLFDGSRYELSQGIASFHQIKDELMRSGLPKDLPVHLRNLIIDLDLIAEAISRRSFGKKFLADADEFSGYSIHAMMEQSPEVSNRITLGRTKDRFSVPSAVIDWRLSNSDIDRLWSGVAQFGAMLSAASLGRVRLDREHAERLFGDQLGFGHHHMGTTRMSRSPYDGVVDDHLRVYGTTNLHVAGSSVFPTGGHVPPTLTIAALAIRLADHFRKAVR